MRPERGGRRCTPLIRPVGPEDGEEVRRIVLGTWRDYGLLRAGAEVPPDLRTFGHGDAAGRRLELVAELDGRVLGSAVLTMHGRREGRLSRLYVAAGGRGRGVGRALLAEVVDPAADLGLRELTLETRSCYREAIHLYEVTGWRRGPDRHDGHGPDRTYRLTLPAPGSGTPAR